MSLEGVANGVTGTNIYVPTQMCIHHRILHIYVCIYVWDRCAYVISSKKGHRIQNSYLLSLSLSVVFSCKRVLHCTHVYYIFILLSQRGPNRYATRLYLSCIFIKRYIREQTSYVRKLSPFDISDSKESNSRISAKEVTKIKNDNKSTLS